MNSHERDGDNHRHHHTRSGDAVGLDDNQSFYVIFSDKMFEYNRSNTVSGKATTHTKYPDAGAAHAAAEKLWRTNRRPYYVCRAIIRVERTEPPVRSTSLT